MLVEYERSFLRDIKAIKDRNIKKDLENLILHVKKADSLHEIGQLKKISGYKDYYRIRIRNYRIGIKLKGETLIFIRVLPRKDIYRYFP
ncbi:type II toxin-antitoxin system RelE family toxin [Thermodesulfatator autotrophicus]|uniref:Plasmid stabilization protein n=1 Tax=Thermodesulfatator autotrophicus TaxID=1795632 RepID=A0A177E6H3_9BACT|nr:plasmid stabilization protein [Thermodesulfatator autotrophicus]